MKLTFEQFVKQRPHIHECYVAPDVAEKIKSTIESRSKIFGDGISADIGSIFGIRVIPSSAVPAGQVIMIAVNPITKKRSMVVLNFGGDENADAAEG